MSADYRVQGEASLDTSSLLRATEEAKRAFQNLDREVNSASRDVDSLGRKSPNVKVSTDTKSIEDAKRKVKELDASKADITVNADTTRALAGIDRLKQTTDAIQAQIDIEADIKKAIAEADRLVAEINDKDAHIAVELDTAKAWVQLGALEHEINKADKKAGAIGGGGGFSGTLSNLMSEGGKAGAKIPTLLAGGVMAAPALIPMAAAATGVLGSITAGFATAAAGAGAFGLATMGAVKEVMSGLKNVEAAQKKLDNAQGAAAQAKALKELNAVYASMSPHVLETVKNVDALKQAFEAFTKNTGDESFKALNTGMNIAKDLMAKLVPLANAVGHEVNGLLDRMKQGVDSKGFAQFLQYLTQVSPTAIDHIANAMWGLSKGVVGILKAFAPSSLGALKSFDDMMQKFGKWGWNLGNTKGFQQFMDYVHSVGPSVVNVIKDLWTVVTKLIVAFSGVGFGSLKVLEAFLNLVAGLPQGVFNALAIGIVAVTTALKGMQIANEAAKALDKLGISASTTNKALAGLAVVGVVAQLADMGIKASWTTPKIQDLQKSMLAFADTHQYTGALHDVADSLNGIVIKGRGMPEVLSKAHSEMQTFTGGVNAFLSGGSQAAKQIGDMDTALAGLYANGNGYKANQMLVEFQMDAKQAGISGSDFAKMFPKATAAADQFNYAMAHTAKGFEGSANAIDHAINTVQQAEKVLSTSSGDMETAAKSFMSIPNAIQAASTKGKASLSAFTKSLEDQIAATKNFAHNMVVMIAAGFGDLADVFAKQGAAGAQLAQQAVDAISKGSVGGLKRMRSDLKAQEALTNSDMQSSFAMMAKIAETGGRQTVQALAAEFTHGDIPAAIKMLDSLKAQIKGTPNEKKIQLILDNYQKVYGNLDTIASKTKSLPDHTSKASLDDRASAKLQQIKRLIVGLPNHTSTANVHDLSSGKLAQIKRETLGLPNKTTTASVHDRASSVLSKINSLSRAQTKRVYIEVYGYQQAYNMISSISNVSSKVAHVGAYLTSHNATGGYIDGPGTKTSDSIPAMLSKGEYVVKADAVEKYGRHFFESLNAQKFATGGMVFPKYGWDYASRYAQPTTPTTTSGRMGILPGETLEQTLFSIRMAKLFASAGYTNSTGPQLHLSVGSTKFDRLQPSTNTGSAGGSSGSSDSSGGGGTTQNIGMYLEKGAIQVTVPSEQKIAKQIAYELRRLSHMPAFSSVGKK